jgi:hypothetical protein
MKNQFSFLLGFVFLFALASCKKEQLALETVPATNAAAPAAAEANSPGSTASAALPGSYTVPIYAGQTIPVGTLTISNDLSNVYVTYEMTGDYKLRKTHLYAGSLENLPVSGGGNAVPGRFPYKTTHNPAVAVYTYTIPLSDFVSNCFVVAAHCEVIATNAGGTITFSQTGWSDGPQVNPGGNWATYTDYCTYFNDNGGD